ncbi:hypothetical protein C8R46DRAFT_1107353 [Mycena filopes]|nr:hypothetical protein C8R46DRAFT_1107353 [Mycena filopes]
MVAAGEVGSSARAHEYAVSGGVWKLARPLSFSRARKSEGRTTDDSSSNPRRSRLCFPRSLSSSRSYPPPSSLSSYPLCQRLHIQTSTQPFLHSEPHKIPGVPIGKSHPSVRDHWNRYHPRLEVLMTDSGERFEYVRAASVALGQRLPGHVTSRSSAHPPGPPVYCSTSTGIRVCWCRAPIPPFSGL